MTKACEPVCSSTDRAIWLEARRDLIGASDKLDRNTLLEKVGAKEPYGGNKWSFMGTMLEAPAIRAFSLWTGMRTRPHGTLLRSTKWPFLGATLDGLCKMPGTDRGRQKMQRYLEGDLGLDPLDVQIMLRDQKLAGLEIKCPVYRKLPEWAETETKKYYRTKKDYEHFVRVADKPPKDYYTQVQHQMLVTGLQVVWLVGMIGGEHLVAHRIEANAEAQRRRLEACEKFWERVRNYNV